MPLRRMKRTLCLLESAQACVLHDVHPKLVHIRSPRIKTAPSLRTSGHETPSVAPGNEGCFQSIPTCWLSFALEHSLERHRAALAVPLDAQSRSPAGAGVSGAGRSGVGVQHLDWQSHKQSCGPLSSESCPP